MRSQCRLTLFWAMVLTSLTWPVSANVQMVGNKCVLVDGKAFFPIGIYQADQSDFPMLAEAGFNTVQRYAWEGDRTYTDGQKWLDAAHQNGLMALVGLCRRDVWEMDWTGTIARIEKYHDHPALLAWQVMDEPGTHGRLSTEYMPAAYRLLKEQDPNHPATAVLCQFSDFQPYAPYLDVVQADYYCIPPIPAGWYVGTGFRGIKMFVDYSRAASGGSNPFWFVCQAFNWGITKAKDKDNDVPAEWQRFPTLRELRTMTYTAIAAGARGVLYWSLDALMNDNNNPGDDDHSQREMHLEWLKTVTRELHQLYPLLTADTPELIQDQDHVVAMVKSDGQDIYIIAANYERQPTQTRISVPGIRQASAELMFEAGDPASIQNGSFIASFEPVESHIWRIKPGQIHQAFPER